MLLEEEWIITLFPSCVEDFALSLDIKNEFSGFAIEINKNYLDIKKFIETVSEQDIFLGIKLHTVIAAFCAYTPAIMVAYQPKCYDFMTTVGMPELTIRCDEVSADSLYDKIGSMYNDIGSIQKSQFAACEKYKQKMAAFRQKIYDRLKV